MPVFEQGTTADNDRAWVNDICDGYQWANHIPFPTAGDSYHQVLGNTGIDGWGGLASRFTNVTIPQGSTINSAHLFIAIQEPLEQTGEDEPGSDFRIYADDVDDSDPLLDGFTVAGARTFTTAFRSGPGEPFGNYGVESWLEQREFDPGIGLVNVIQEIINRPGWVPGNALTLIMTGQFQAACACGFTFEGIMRLAAWENTNGEEGLQGEISPRLVIDYTEPIPPTIRAAPIII